MDRLQFSRNIIQKELGFSPLQLDYIFALPGKKTFEVIFTTFTLFEQCLERYNQKKDDNPRLRSVALNPLSERESKTVTVIMFSEKITTEDIATWLSFQCSVLRGIELRDEDGIRTGARRFYVRLRRDGNSGQLHHLPSTIQLGSVRGHVFYAGQPKTCRKCGSTTHLAVKCEMTLCKNCQSGDHSTRDCPQPRKCNLCGSNTHTFRDCPQSYANRTRQPNFNHDSEQVTITMERHNEHNEQQVAALAQLSSGNYQTNVEQESQSAVVPTHQEQSTSVTKPPSPQDQSRANQNEEIFVDESQRDWSEESTTTSQTSVLFHPTSTPNQLQQSSQELQDKHTSQEDLPAGQSTPAVRTAVSAKDCRDLLDLMLTDLSTTADNLASEVVLERTPPIAEEKNIPEPTSSRKRGQDISGESSSGSPDPDKWASAVSNSSPFLDPHCLTAFSEATQMRDEEGVENKENKDWRTQRKKKKKVKNFLM